MQKIILYPKLHKTRAYLDEGILSLEIRAFIQEE